MTPFELEILMHHYVCPINFPRDTPAYRNIRDDFHTLGIFSDSYGVTELGKAYVVSILRTKIPTTKYVDEQNKIIEVTE